MSGGPARRARSLFGTNLRLGPAQRLAQVAQRGTWGLMAGSKPQSGIGALNLHGVEIALRERRPTHEDWTEVFSAQSFGQFMETLDLVLDNFEFLFQHHERPMLLRLLIALTAKLREAGYFHPALRTEAREQMLARAQALHDFARSLITDPTMRDRLSYAWAEATDYGETYGYKADAIFAIIIPMRVFAHDTPN